MNKLLQIKNLSISFKNNEKFVNAVNGVNLDVFEGEILALAGESASGKTLTALSITRLLPYNAVINSGEIIFNQRNLLNSSEGELEDIRGKEISYIFQEAQASLNPVLSIGRQIMEPIIVHQKKTESQARAMAVDLLKMVKLPYLIETFKCYPHQLSGGMNQRVMIAMALASRAKLLIADEPTTALDVTIEKEIIKMLLELREEFGFAILFITHNLHLVEKFAGRVAIMFQGRIVEIGRTSEIFSNPQHEHTKALIESIIKI